MGVQVMPPGCSSKMVNEDIGLNDDDAMFEFENRLKSFGDVGKWFESGPSSKSEMAKQGLYIPDEEHRQRKSVKCVYCRHSFLDWMRNDSPKVRHEDEAPDCLFMDFGKSELDLTIEQLLELQKFASIRKLEEAKILEINMLKTEFEEARREFLSS